MLCSKVEDCNVMIHDVLGESLHIIHLRSSSNIRLQKWKYKNAVRLSSQLARSLVSEALRKFQIQSQ